MRGESGKAVNSRRTILLVLLASLILLMPGCGRKPEAPASGPDPVVKLPDGFPPGEPYFVRVPPPHLWSRAGTTPPSFAVAGRWGPYYDLRHTDLSRFDLADHASDLGNAVFDTETIWPAALPFGFDPAKALEFNRNPGLGIRDVHARGITGRGVAVSVIDAPLLLDHAEYAGRIRFYGEVNARNAMANFHGTLVTSILAGRSCGVAPDAEIYYVGSQNTDASSVDGSMTPNAGHYAKAIELLLEVNARLHREQRIRVISISTGWGPKNPGYKAMNDAVRRAADAEIFVVSSNVFEAFEPGFWFWGLDRASTDSPDDPGSYQVLSWKDWIYQVAGRDNFDKFYRKRLRGVGSPEFLVFPEGSKTVANPGGPNEYGFYRMGGWSSICPYIAGLYALACQVRPDITPAVFWRAALATGDPIAVKGEKKTYAGKRVNPVRLIEGLR